MGNPRCYFLTGSEAHDLVGADHLVPTMQAHTLIADKACPAIAAGVRRRCPRPRTAERCVQNRGDPAAGQPDPRRDYDRQFYSARHLIDNFSVKIQ